MINRTNSFISSSGLLPKDASGELSNASPVAACNVRRLHGSTNHRRIASSAVAHIA